VIGDDDHTCIHLLGPNDGFPAITLGDLDDESACWLFYNLREDKMGFGVNDPVLP
jgi:hypothetical protein